MLSEVNSCSVRLDLTVNVDLILSPIIRWLEKKCSAINFEDNKVYQQELQKITDLRFVLSKKLVILLEKNQNQTYLMWKCRGGEYKSKYFGLKMFVEKWRNICAEV
jgi:hypothetical protein